MPAFFFGGPEADPAAYYLKRPVFDVRRQPSEMGLLSELFRRRESVRRSLHPTASVCALGHSRTRSWAVITLRRRRSATVLPLL